MENLFNTSGEIILKRQKQNFSAGFCLIKEELPNLVKKLSLLHQSEQEYYNTLLFNKRKASYLLGRLAARLAISGFIKTKDTQSFYVDFGVFQFPVVKSSVNYNIQVSISHCDDIGIALAFPEAHPLGIDIERISPDKIEIIKSQIGNNESDLISNCGLSLPVGGVIIWTVREALSKIFKAGLTMDPKTLEIASLKNVDSVYISSFSYFSQYKAISCHAGNYICSIVVPANTTAELEDFWNALRSMLIEDHPKPVR
ncbi:MAG: 4'-phosphopantetheinyl transferase superfamily protein [Chitinophagaceae bacterium]